MKKYKLLGWNEPSKKTYLETASKVLPYFENIINDFNFPKMTKSTGEIDDDGFPIVYSGLEFPYDKFSITWFNYEEI